MSTTNFKGIHHYGLSELNNQLEDNYVEWIKYNLLNIGAFGKVTLASTGHYSNDNYCTLRPVKDIRYGNSATTTKVWEGFRGDWIWESGINYVTQPITISGVYVGSGFLPAPNATGYIIDYPKGRIIFNEARPITENVRCEFSYRRVTCGKSSLPWAERILLNAYRIDIPDFSLFGSGNTFLPENRITLPAVIAECYPTRSYEPWQVGGGQIVKQDIIFHNS